MRSYPNACRRSQVWRARGWRRKDRRLYARRSDWSGQLGALHLRPKQRRLHEGGLRQIRVIEPGLVQDDPVEPRISEIGPVELCGRGLSVSSRMANTVAPNDANVLQRPSGA